MKVAVYCRLSEEDRNKQFETDDSNSIQNQKAMLLQYAMEQGWELYNIYSDDDYTGSDRRRPEFNRLLKDAEEIRLLDVVSLLEGTVRLNRCLENDCYCSRGAAPDCPVRKCYEVMQQKWESFLRGITIADILAGIEKEEVEKRIDGAAHQK